jgi:serine/threonine protein kinase
VNPDGENYFTNKADIWALGCILYELVNRKKLFADDYRVYSYSMEYLYFKQALEIHIECNHVLIDQSTKSFLSDIIHEMLQIDTSRRPTAKELYEVFHALLCSETVLSSSQIGYEFMSRFHESSLLRRRSTIGTILSMTLSNMR